MACRPGTARGPANAGSAEQQTRIGFQRVRTVRPYEFPAAMTVKVIGYARVSTQDQNLDLQRDALERAVCL